ncbi:hypothetical protein [Ensifer aridi]|uniref:hypothetical protein n=1 Tax=Ensifer aridi TaxID=1708715 RepID=UPI00358FD44E
MAIVNGTKYPNVTEILKISDTEEGQGTGVYDLEIMIQFFEGSEPEFNKYRSRPDDPHGINPQIRQWMSENPDAPVHVYVPPPPPTAEEIRAAMPQLTARQFRLGLVSSDITPSQVQACLEAMPQGIDRDKALIEWEYATTFNRMHPLIATVGAALGLTDEQIDAMWTAAIDL